jgi:hypothetical protein
MIAVKRWDGFEKGDMVDFADFKTTKYVFKGLTMYRFVL